MLGLVMPPDYWGVMQLPTFPWGWACRIRDCPNLAPNCAASLISAESLVMGARGRPGSGRPEGGVDRPTGGDNGRRQGRPGPAAESTAMCIVPARSYLGLRAVPERPPAAAQAQQAVSASSRSGDDG